MSHLIESVDGPVALDHRAGAIEFDIVQNDMVVLLDPRIDRLLCAIDQTLQFLMHILRCAFVELQKVKVIPVE